LELSQEPLHLLSRENDWEALGLRDVGDLIRQLEVTAQHALVQEEDRPTSLRLGSSGHLLGHCEILQKRNELQVSDILRMAHARPLHEPFDPAEIRALGSRTHPKNPCDAANFRLQARR
jgi:hypothetical protein